MSRGRVAFCASLLVFGLLAASAPAFADDCRPLTLITSVQMTPELSANGRLAAELVPVAIDGVQKLMLLDTGASFSAITADAAEELNLSHHTMTLPIDYWRREIYDISGEHSDQEADVPELVIGNLATKSVGLAVWPGKNPFGGDARIAGMLGANVLRFYDTDIDFSANRLNLLSPDHCTGKVVYWPAAAVAVVPIRVTPQGMIALTVKLDGKPVTAEIDSGAYSSILFENSAEDEFGLKMGAPDTPQVGQNPDGSASYRHRFATLDFEDVAVGNPDILLLPDNVNRAVQQKPELGTRLSDPGARETTDMLIGMDVLRHLHIYIAYKEGNLYITPGTAPQTSAAAQPPH